MKSDNRIVESWALSEYREVERGGLYGGSTYTQNVTERIDGMDVIIHRYFYSDDPNAGKGEIYMEEGILEKQTVSERTEFTVVGIVGSYVGKWDMGERELPGILLSEAGGERLLHAVYSQQTADVSGFQPKADVFLNFSGGIPAQTAGFPVYRNRYTFPESGDTDDVMTGTLMAAIFLASVFAVFQVFLTQMKKRSRHISLLKCIAFSNRQILAMLLWEGVYVLLAALPFGLCFGIGGAWILTGSMKNMLGYEVVFAPDMGRLMIGILLGALALFGGMLLPMISALRAPLTGSLVKVGKRQRRIAKVSGKEPDIHKKRGFGFLTIRYYQFNRGKAFMNLLLITISAFMLLLTVFLCYQSFEPYRENLASGQPDYTLELPYTLGKSAQEKLLAPLQENEAIADIQIQKKGLDLVYAGENSEFGKSSLYAVRTDSPFYERYVSQITEGKIDKDAFERGEEVIVLVPLSRKDGFTYEKRYSSILLPDDRVKAGDTVHLSAISKRVTENGIESIDKHAHVTAAGIISWFDTDPIWPFTENKESFAVIGSENLIYDLYPYMRGGIGNATPEEVTQMIATYDLNHYGKTLYDIRLAETDTPELADRQLLLLAEKMCGTLRNYRDARESMYYRAMNRSMITALLGISVAVIVTLILYNMSVSRMEQERKRTGVLQSLGFGGKQFIRMYLGEGLLFGAGALVISDALFLLILLATTAEMGVQMRAAAAVRDFFLYRLQGFPWLLVIAIHVGILLVSACIACIPAKKVTGRAPIENIRELESE